MENENAPDPISCSSQVIDLCFHPHQSIVAVSTISGIVEFWKYPENATVALPGTTLKAGESERVLSLNLHSECVRRVIANESGDTVFTGSADKSITAVGADGQLRWRVQNAHTSSVNCMSSINQNVLVTADEDGCLKVWDTRTNPTACVTETKEHTDFIADMEYHAPTMKLLTAGGDGRLGVHELRMPAQRPPKLKFEGKSDEQEDELLSLAIMKHGQKVVVGTQDGVLDFWSWGHWGDMSDRFPGHPQSVDCLLKIDEETLCTGSSDGIIRVVQIFPNKLLGVIGDHDDFPIERMRYSKDRKLIGTASHDNQVKFWDVAFLFEKDEDGKESTDNGMRQGSLDAGNQNDTDSDEDMDMDSDDEEESDNNKTFGMEDKGSFFADM